MIIIDGPPGKTCHWARYPAVPIVLDAASGTDISIVFLLDDMIRTDEKEMALAWEERIKTFGLSYERIDYSFEKGGMLLKVHSLARVDTSLIRSEALASEKQEHEAIKSAITQSNELLAELESVKQAAAKETLEAQKAIEKLGRQLKAKKAELQKVVSERDAQTQQKGVAQQRVTLLNKQLDEKDAELQKVVSERDAQAKQKEVAQQQVTELNKQLDARDAKMQKVVSERDAHAKLKGVVQQKLDAQSSKLLATQNVLDEKDAELRELEEEFHHLRLRHIRNRGR